MRLRVAAFRHALDGKPVYFLQERRSFLGIRYWHEVAFPTTRGSTPERAETYAAKLREPLPAPREV